MPKFTIQVRDRATIDIIATVEVEAESYQAAIDRVKNADPMKEEDAALWDLDFEPDIGLGWWDRHGETEYS